MHLAEATGVSRSSSLRDMSQVELLVLSTILLAWSGNHRSPRSRLLSFSPFCLCSREFYLRRVDRSIFSIVNSSVHISGGGHAAERQRAGVDRRDGAGTRTGDFQTVHQVRTILSYRCDDLQQGMNMDCNAALTSQCDLRDNSCVYVKGSEIDRKRKRKGAVFARGLRRERFTLERTVRT